MSGNTREPSKVALMIREGANLPEEVWQDARIAAVMGQLPKQIRELPKEQMFACAIQFFGTAQRYDLDPMQGEIFGWWDRKQGRMVCMVGRDGLLKIASREKDILGIQSDIVREGDTFRKIQKGDKISVEHISEPFAEGGGKTIGAYALITKREGPDVFVARRKDQYEHLAWKENWKTNPDEMLETRVASFGLRKSTPLLAGVYTEGDFAFSAPSGDDGATPIDRRREIPATSRSDALADTLEGETEYEIVEVEAEVVEPGDETREQTAQRLEGEAVDIREATVTSEPHIPMLETSGEIAPGYFVEHLSRGWCALWRVADTDEFDAGDSVYAESTGCNVIQVTDKRFRLPDLITFAAEDFEQYETTAAAQV